MRTRAAAILCVFISVLLAALSFLVGSDLRAQQPNPAPEKHLTVMGCMDVPPGQARPEFGCFNIATEKGLQFPETNVYWHLRIFPNRPAAETAKSATGMVVEEDGRVWQSEFGARDLALKGGQPVAVIGPLQLPAAKSYTAVLSFAVLRPGDRSMVHTHAGPEAWYMLAGEQCLETPAGTRKAKAGETMAASPNVPMELAITGTAQRKSLVLVIHDSAQPQALPSDWKPLGGCGSQLRPRALP
jgi:quercetin dioxygenase-like cupin family protein